MMANTFKWGGATIGAKELTIGDDEEISALMQRMGEGDKGMTTRYICAEFMLAVDMIEGEPPLVIVTVDDSDTAILSAFSQWRKLPRRFGQQWRTILAAAETDPKP